MNAMSTKTMFSLGFYFQLPKSDELICYFCVGKQTHPGMSPIVNEIVNICARRVK